MYQNAAILAAFLLIYSAIAGRIERSLISGPIVFTAAGFILGPDGLDVLRLNITGEGLRLLAELTLAMVLFTDAANADFGIVRRNLGLPERLLLIGLPLTIILGFLVAAIVLPALSILEMALLAALLAPTDAALGQPVVTNPTVSPVTREALNLESGLNDGICVPIVVLLLGLAVGTQMEGATVGDVARVVVEAIGIGAAVGLALTWSTVLMLRFAERQGWISENWVEIPIVALAAVCFAGAQAAGGSGFIACFVGGLLLSGLGERHKQDLLRGAEHMGEALALLTWVVFGSFVVARMIDRVTWPALLYAVLSLTVVRMLPVYLCLMGTRTSTADKLFIGWFGPRGLATIVFAVLVLHERLPGNDTIMLAAGWAVLLSVIAHGVTANPLVKAIGGVPKRDLVPGEQEADVACNPPDTRALRAN
jgi:sodium/hydrogen antiporter